MFFLFSIFNRTDLFCHQEEADTRIFFHAKILSRSKARYRHNSDTEDTDVIVIAAYVSTILQKKSIWYRRKQQIKCSGLCLTEVANMLIGSHALTGADAVSGFYRQSKKTVFKKIHAKSESRHLLYHIGRKKHLSEKDISDVTNFVTKLMHNDKQSSTLVQGLPPDEDSFHQHLLRANYQAKIWYNSESASAPEDSQHYGYSGQYGLMDTMI